STLASRTASTGYMRLAMPVLVEGLMLRAIAPHLHERRLLRRADFEQTFPIIRQVCLFDIRFAVHDYVGQVVYFNRAFQTVAGTAQPFGGGSQVEVSGLRRGGAGRFLCDNLVPFHGLGVLTVPDKTSKIAPAADKPGVRWRRRRPI